MLPFKVPGKDRFVLDTTFDDILNLYLFDKDLRLLIFDVIERVEVAFRTQMSYQHSLSRGPYWFEDRNNFRDANRWREQLEKVDGEVGRAKEVFKDHFFSKYDEHVRMPIWMTSEVLSLGLLSKIYRNLKNSREKKNISGHFGVASPLVLESWMQSMTYVRNICAHHSRLWNRILTVSPTFLESPTNPWIETRPDNSKLYYFVCCLGYMLRTINPDSRFTEKLKILLTRYTKLDLKAMGFPEGWETEIFWN